MTENLTQATRPRTCIGCGQTDDGPRHCIGVNGGGQITWHLDCHAIATNCDSCQSQVDKANGLKDTELREFILTNITPTVTVANIS